MELNKALIREDDGDYYNEVTIKYDNNVFTFNFWEIRGPLIKLDFDSLIDFRWQVEINKTENLIFDMIKELDEVNAQISKLLKRRAELTDSINGYNNSLNNIFVDSFSEEKDG
jgi:hypothetical protein